MTNAAAFHPDWVSHPGETIADLLEEKGWSQAELAERTGFTRKHINELVTGKTSLTPDAALKLESTLGGSARFWLSREAQFREQTARKALQANLEASAHWLTELPLRDMVRLSWIAKAPTAGAQVAECLRFFGVASIDAWREKHEKPLAAFRASSGVNRSAGAIAAWLRQGERVASAIECRSYDEARFRAVLHDARQLTLVGEPKVFIPKLIDLCAQCGVAVVFVPTFTGCPASGATRWLAPDKAILQLSLRYRTNDHLWFTVFHEAGHLILHGKRLLFLEGANAIDDAHENEADQFARDILIPPDQASRLQHIEKSHTGVQRFAHEVGIAPGIVVGRMQKEKLLPWSHLNRLKLRYTWVDEQR
jgi:HTH-type transcriptional regulator/antitoxin HigA